MHGRVSVSGELGIIETKGRAKRKVSGALWLGFRELENCGRDQSF